MNHRSFRPRPANRFGLLSVVIGLHTVLLVLILTHKTVLPEIAELPLIVDLIEAIPLPVAPAATPSAPASAPSPPTPLRPRAQKKPARPQPQEKAQPTLETTTASTPATEHAPWVAAEAARPAAAQAAVGHGTMDAAWSQARFDADYLHNPPPTYPPLSRRLGEEGKVVLRVQVSAAGVAGQVEIKTSSGSARLDEAAQRTVRHWKFVPAKRGGTPVESWVLVPIHFRLEQ